MLYIWGTFRQADGFENLMVEHIISGSYLGTLLIMCFTIAGILAVLTDAICLRNYFLARGWMGDSNHIGSGSREYIVDYHRNRDLTDKKKELNRITRRRSLSRASTHSTSARESPPPFVHMVPTSAPEIQKNKNKLSAAEILTKDSPMLYPFIKIKTPYHAYGNEVFNTGAQEV
jgi:hypothetical protein